MVVILEAVSGPVLGRRIEVRGGSIVRFGRTGKSDYPIAEDGYLSGLHFSVECDGTQCRIRDLGSSNGTFVNGSRVTEQVVQDGDSVVAGGSTFRIHVDLLPDDHRRRDCRESARRRPRSAVATKAMGEPAAASQDTPPPKRRC